jgi:AGCS family alanine or glycine:cation symporter
LQDTLLEFVSSLNANVLWGTPMLILLVGTGVYLTLLLRGLQLRKLGYALRWGLIKRREQGAAGDISHFQALMTALSATVGTGNIAGVATAIAAGGPGALFWMWMTGLFGMATKYAEALLAVRYREVDEMGTMSGGPMYYIRKGIRIPFVAGPLAVAFALFASVAAFGIGNMVQSNSVADAMHSSFGVPTWASGAVMAIAAAAVILGGIRSIGRVTAVLVPVMIVFYMGAALVVVWLNLSGVPEMIRLVFVNAFTPTAAIGGFAGATVREGIRFGVARGVFSNESGLGSAPIAAAAAQTGHPVRQALVSMTQTFIDTLVVCSLTGFAIISAGVWRTGDTGAPLTVEAFSHGLPGQWGGILVTVALVLFAYSTILGWSYYGEKSFEFLFRGTAEHPGVGRRFERPLVFLYRAVFCAVVFGGAVIHKVDLVWEFADSMNALMAIPNLIALIALSGVIARETRRYFEEQRD